jgi:hypothetical protein
MSWVFLAFFIQQIVLSLSKNAMLAKHTTTKYDHTTPLHPVVSVGPFAKWGIDFMTCHPHSARGHGYIIVAIDYFEEVGRGDAYIRQYRKDCSTIHIQSYHCSFWCSSSYRY